MVSCSTGQAFTYIYIYTSNEWMALCGELQHWPSLYLYIYILVMNGWHCVVSCRHWPSLYLYIYTSNEWMALCGELQHWSSFYLCPRMFLKDAHLMHPWLQMPYNTMGWLLVKQKCIMCEIRLREEGFVKTTWKQRPLRTKSEVIRKCLLAEGSEGKTKQKLSVNSNCLVWPS